MAAADGRARAFFCENGAEAVAVAELDYVFSRDNPLFANFEAAL